METFGELGYVSTYTSGQIHRGEAMHFIDWFLMILHIIWKRNGFKWFNHSSFYYDYIHQLWNYIYYVSTKIYQYCPTLNPCNWPACRTYEIAPRFWVVVICPIIKCLTVLEFSFILFDLCLFIKIFNFILNYVLIVTFWIFTYHKIWILLIIYCFIWNYWITYFLTCFEVFWSVVS